MNNQIYIRLGRPNKYKTIKEDKPMHPIMVFITRSILIMAFLYFFLDDVIRFLFMLF